MSNLAVVVEERGPRPPTATNGIPTHADIIGPSKSAVKPQHCASHFQRPFSPLCRAGECATVGSRGSGTMGPSAGQSLSPTTCSSLVAVVSPPAHQKRLSPMDTIDSVVAELPLSVFPKTQRNFEVQNAHVWQFPSSWTVLRLASAERTVVSSLCSQEEGHCCENEGHANEVRWMARHCTVDPRLVAKSGLTCATAKGWQSIVFCV